MSIQTIEEYRAERQMNGWGAEAPEVDYDFDGSDLYIETDQTRMAMIAEAKLSDESMQPVQEAAALLGRVMDEFVSDGEDFRVQEDSELKTWLRELVSREIPALTADDRDQLLDSLLGFPPVTPAERQYGQVQVADTHALLERGVVFGDDLSVEAFTMTTD